MCRSPRSFRVPSAAPRRRAQTRAVSHSLCLLFLLACLVHPLHAWTVREHVARTESLDRPVMALSSPVGAFSLALPCGELQWLEGRCRILPLPLDSDTILAVELVGSGFLKLDMADSLEALSTRAFLGRRWQRNKVRRVCLLLPTLPLALKDLAWARQRPVLPFLPPRPFFSSKGLERLHPDNPLLWSWKEDACLWLSCEPGDLHLWMNGESWRLSRPLHDGSRIEAVVAQSSRPMEGAWLAPTFHAPACAVDGQSLELDSQGERLMWTWRTTLKEGTAPLFLLLDPAAKVEKATWWWTLPGSPSTPAQLARDGAWVVVEGTGTAQNTTLELKGSIQRVRVREDSPRQMACSAADWFPRHPWWVPALPTTVTDERQLLGVGERWSGLLDGRAPRRFLPCPGNAEQLTQDLSLCWTPLAEQASRPRPAWTPPPRHTGDIANLELKRDRELRPPGHEEAAEPRDLALGQDSLGLAMLGEDGGAELAWAAEQLRQWLGAPAFPVRLWERSHALGKSEERDRLLLAEGPGLLPLEITASDLRSADANARLRVLERLCLAWWEAPSMESAGEARWLSLGAARACALRLLEMRTGAELPSRLRQDALKAEAASFQPKAFASLPWLGERAEGDWSSHDLQERLAWRLVLALEQLRWQLRDPASLDDALYLDLLVAWRDRRMEALSPRRPLDDLASALGGLLVGEELLEGSAFGTMPVLRQWLDCQWTQCALPTVQVESGRVETPQGAQLALKVAWESPVAAGTVLPVLLRHDQGLESYSLRCTRQEESFLLPVDPARVTGMEIAPGGSLPARIRMK